MINKLKNIVLGWWFRITNSNYDLYKERIEICNSCDKKIKILGDDYCSACGCSLKAKCRVKDEKCLMDKWNE